MNFLTMYADIDENVFIGKIKPYDSIKSISISKFNENKLVNTYSWDIAPSTKTKGLLPYLHEAWEEIQPIIFNKTVIMFDANFTIQTIIQTFEYLINKTIPNTKPAERYFPDLLQKLKEIRFDYMCLSLIIRRIFKDSPSNKLSDLCKSANIDFNFTSKGYSQAIGALLNYVLEKTNTYSLIELKHLSGITLGQVMKNISLRENSQSGKIIEYDKYYYSCLPITDKELFRKYDFK